MGADIRAVLGLYQNLEHVETTVERLKKEGFYEKNLILLKRTSASKVGELLITKPEKSAALGSLIGLGVGSILGLLAGLTIIPLAGVDISLLVTGITGTIGGAAMGTYLGGLYGERASTYHEYEFKEKLANDDALLLIAHPNDKNRQKIAVDIMKETKGEYVGVFKLDEEEFNQLSSKPL
jgi:hypothetical protein